jgi:PAS domain S-box-containing protein
MTATEQAARARSLRAGGLASPFRFGLLRLLREWQPPLDRREFWAVQLLVVVIAGGHFVLEAAAPETHSALSFIPTSLFLIPVIYAALSFGLHGSLPTALWCAVLTVPNAFVFHSGDDRLGELWQIGLVIAVAAFVGPRIDREKRARREAEEREQARRASEEKYRGIFDHVAEPILLLKRDGRIDSANRAAGQLFGLTLAQLEGRPISELIEVDLHSSAAIDGRSRAVRQLASGADRPRWVEPVLIPLADGDGSARSQLMLRDLTPEYERQQELEAYARRTTSAREEERGRIARELHDGPVQTLVLLWRRLDGLAMADQAQEAELRAAQAAVRDAADELRRVSRNLRPSILHDLGLTSALRAEVAAFGQRSGIVGRLVRVGSERRLAREREVALLRIAQEALRNVEQHAHARCAIVRLRYGTNGVRLSITDDGEGIVERAPSELAVAGKLGLIGMREQARLIGGSLTIGSGRRGGTVITVTVAD